MRNLLIKTFFLFSILLFSAFISATENAPIARLEHRPIQHPNYQQNHGPVQQYHPAARNDARQDINRAEDVNALNNAGNYGGVPETVPVYPAGTPSNTVPGNPANTGNSVNINTVPQSVNPQH